MRRLLISSPRFRGLDHGTWHERNQIDGLAELDCGYRLVTCELAPR